MDHAYVFVFGFPAQAGRILGHVNECVFIIEQHLVRCLAAIGQSGSR